VDEEMEGRGEGIKGGERGREERNGYKEGKGPTSKRAQGGEGRGREGSGRGLAFLENKFTKFMAPPLVICFCLMLKFYAKMERLEGTMGKR